MVNEEKNSNKVQDKKVNKANVGDIIEVKRGQFKGAKGEVLIVRENSVIIKMGMNEKTEEPIKTVVNHKNYRKIKS